MTAEINKANAVRMVMAAIVEAIIESEPAGMPSGHLYAAVMGHGMSLEGYESLMAGLTSAGVITKPVGHVYHSTELGRVFVSASKRSDIKMVNGQ